MSKTTKQCISSTDSNVNGVNISSFDADQADERHISSVNVSSENASVFNIMFYTV